MDIFKNLSVGDIFVVFLVGYTMLKLTKISARRARGIVNGKLKDLPIKGDTEVRKVDE